MAKKIKTTKKKSNKNAKLILLFAVTFVTTLFLVSTMIKNYSPTVDVNIGGEEIALQDEPDEFPDRDIDDRLKWIQFEDNMSESPVVNEINDSDNKTANAGVKSDSIYNNSSSKKIANEKKSDFQNKSKYINDIDNESPLPVRYKVQAPIPSVSDIQNKNTTNVSAKMTKVFIGYYSTQEEAENIKKQIISSVSGFQPYVKKINNNYIVQIGSFSDRTKAVNMKLELSDKGFPARLMTE